MEKTSKGQMAAAKMQANARVTYGLSIPSDLSDILDGAWDKIHTDVVGDGCGSTEYAFDSKADRDKARRLLSNELLNFSARLRHGDHDFDNEEESQ